MKKTTIALSKSKRTERLQVHLQPEELAAIHDFQYSNRLPTRAAAVRELIATGVGFDRKRTLTGAVKCRGPLKRWRGQAAS